MSELGDVQSGDRSIHDRNVHDCGDAQLETLIDSRGKEWTVRLRRPDGHLYTVSRGFWWKPHSADNKEWQKVVGVPMKAAQERIMRLWLATRAVQ